MSYLDLSLKQIHEALKSGKITSKELVLEAIMRAKKLQESSNAFVTISEKEALDFVEKIDKIDNLFAGIPYACKDNFSTKGIRSTGSSKILDNYVPIYDAEVVRLLKEAKAVQIGKTILDELAMGGNGLSGHTGVCRNPLDLSRQIGGSSAGSCAAVCAGVVPFAIGSDTGDSIRKPASFGGIVGFKPTWSRISRYGLYSFTPSLDHVGFFTRTVEDASFVFDLLNGHDKKDFTSSFQEKEITHSQLHPSLKNVKIAVLGNILNTMHNQSIHQDFVSAMESAKKEGASVDFIDVDLHLYRTIYATYMILSCAEATSNNACLDGINFGNTQSGKNIDDVVIHTRSNGFNPAIKRRFVLGSYILSKENQEIIFNKAKKARKMIVDDVKRILDTYDVIILPASGNIAPLIENPEKIDPLSDEYLILENYMAIGNFGGFPSITIPFTTYKNMPVGLNITGKAFEDGKVLAIAAALESCLGGKK